MTAAELRDIGRARTYWYQYVSAVPGDWSITDSAACASKTGRQ